MGFVLSSGCNGISAAGSAEGHMQSSFIPSLKNAQKQSQLSTGKAGLAFMGFDLDKQRKST